MKKLVINNKNYSLASNWNELSEQQFLKASYLYAKSLTESTDETKQIQRNSTLMSFFYVATTPTVPLAIFNQIPSYQWVDILKHMEWFFEAPKLDRSPVKKVRSLFGPINNLETSSLLEMVECENAFTDASNRQSTDKMYLLFAILYRPKRKDLMKFRASEEWNGDIREAFNMKKCEDRIAYIKKNIPFHYIVAAYVFYWSFHEHALIGTFAPLFEGGDKKPKVGNDYGWAGIMLGMANTKFGTLDETGRQNWFTVLVEMNRQVDIYKSNSNGN